MLGLLSGAIWENGEKQSQESGQIRRGRGLSFSGQLSGTRSLRSHASRIWRRTLFRVMVGASDCTQDSLVQFDPHSKGAGKHAATSAYASSWDGSWGSQGSRVTLWCLRNFCPPAFLSRPPPRYPAVSPVISRPEGNPHHLGRLRGRAPRGLARAPGQAMIQARVSTHPSAPAPPRTFRWP